MVAVAQLAERRNVAPEAAGSNPVRHPRGGQVTGYRGQQATAALPQAVPRPYPLFPEVLALVEERQTRPAQTREAVRH